MACISGYSDSQGIYEYIEPYVTKLSDDVETKSYYNKVFVNGRWAGTDTPIELYKDLKDKKYKGLVHIYTSIVFNTNEKIISICNDCGRLVRPLFKARDNSILLTKDIIRRIKTNELTWNDLCLSNKVDESVIEYVDAEEQLYSMVSMNHRKMVNNEGNERYNYTHSEIHPSTIFGVLASVFHLEHNQLQEIHTNAMGKPIGVYVSNFNKRMDKTAYILNYAMRPLVETRVNRNLTSFFQTVVAYDSPGLIRR